VMVNNRLVTCRRHPNSVSARRSAELDIV
jgi:hypothetical protein